MPADQKEIHYLIGDSRSLIENSPYLETCRARGQEVLLLTDPIDEFVIESLGEYKEKKLKAVDKGAAEDTQSEEVKKAAEQLKDLFQSMQAKLPEVKEVRVTGRLKESAACLVADESDMMPTWSG